ncbi:MAG: hypothetical protein LBQ13_03415 [Endomicrobium sp.]|jgi:hypothetical protein|nr:hypothetical protein [Endomicrobium sp.]
MGIVNFSNDIVEIEKEFLNMNYKEYNKTMELSPDFANAYFYLSFVYNKNNNFENTDK